MLNDIKKMRVPFELLGMKIDTDHTQCPSPEHEGKTTVSCHTSNDGTILWKCHRCNTSGSIVDAYMLAHGVDQASAIDMLKDQFGRSVPEDIKRLPKLVKEDYKKEPPIEPTSAPIPDPPEGSWVIKVNGKATRLKYEDATYFDVAPYKIGDDIFFAAAIRWDIGNEKIMRQMHYHNGEWSRKKAPTKQQPIYKMHEIEKSSHNTTIMIVEGEKCMRRLQEACDFANKTYEAFPNVIVTTHLGGSNNWKKSDWSTIGNRPVFIIRDNDEPGFKWAKSLKSVLNNAHVLDIAQPTSPKNYDVYDWLEDGGDVRRLFKMTPVQVEEDNRSILLKAMEIAKDIEPLEVNNFLAKVVSADPNPIQLDLIMQAIKDSTGISIGAMRQSVKSHQQETALDWPITVARAVVADTYNGSLIYSSGIFWGYTGTHWDKIPDKVIENKILDLAERMMPPDEYDSEMIIRKGSRVLTALVAVGDDVLKQTAKPEPIINCKNGEVHIDIHTGEVELKPHNPKSYLRHCLDIDYDPDASCPEWDKAVNEIFSFNKNMVRHFEEVAGYIIQPHRKFKNFFMAYGSEGNNGKSSIFFTLAELAGDGNCTFAKMKSFGNSRHDTSKLVGKVMLLDDDLDKDVKLSDGLIKQLSEGKLIDVEYKHKDTFEIYSYAAVVMLCNHWPMTTDLTKAMRKRAMILPFYRSFGEDEIDANLFDRIKANELPGVLNRLLEGIKRLFTRGRWDTPIECDAAKQDWLGETSSLYAFYLECLSEEPGEYIYSRELRTCYENWCREEGVQDKYMVQTRKLKSAMRDLGLKISERTNNNYGKWKVVGYKLVDTTDTTD